jgi:hypothetical protein
MRDQFLDAINGWIDDLEELSVARVDQRAEDRFRFGEGVLDGPAVVEWARWRGFG